ncbi:MAG: hypothetical protein ABFC96_12135 [Thermoguttaceae bacterium]
MKTIQHALVGWMALATVLGTSVVVAGPIQGTLQSTLGAAVLGQAVPAANPTDSPDQQTADLLRRARLAMSDKDLDAAESLISKAESLGVPYSPFYMGDTPKKARRDLDRQRNAAATDPAKPSRLFSPLRPGNNDRRTDPFAGRGVDPQTTGGYNALRPLPQVGGATAGQPTGYAMAQPGQGDVRAPGSVPPGMDQMPASPTQTPVTAPAASNSPLKTARLALAVGDVRRAEEYVLRAKAMRVNYQPMDDTPDRVEAAIRKHQELSALDKSTEAYSRLYVRSLMDQADGLARWGEYATAEQLADRAAGIHIVYGPFEQKPQELLNRIAAARRQTAGRAPAGNLSTPGFAMAATGPSATPESAMNPQSMSSPQQKAADLMRQARDAIAAGQLDRAESFALAADRMQLPDAGFGPGGDRPALVLADIRQMRAQRAQGRSDVVQAAQYVAGASDRGATRAVYDAGNDPTRNTQVSNQQPAPWLAQNQNQNRASMPEQTPTPPPEPRPGVGNQSPGMALFQQGEDALKAHDVNRAFDFFRQAARYQNDLDPMTAQRLQDHLQMLSARSRTQPQSPMAPGMMADDAANRMQVLARQVAADLAHREANARAMRETDPKGALAMLEEARKRVEEAGLDSALREQMLRRVDRAIADTKQVIDTNRPQIELAEKNKEVRDQVERTKKVKLEVDEKFAVMVNECNKLMEEERYDEAIVLAKRAAELAPDNPVATQLLWQTKFVRNYQKSKSIRDQKEEGVFAALESVDISGIPPDDRVPYVHGDAKEWEKLSLRRQKFAKDGHKVRSEREIEIEKKLRTPVSPQFTNAPLSKVMDYLAKLGGVNVYLDPQGLAEEGVTTDTPITIDLRQEIMLKSALNLILQPLHLSYVIKDEVLKITSEQMRDVQVETRTYYVGDLVQSIPNFVPGSTGLDGAYKNAVAEVGMGGPTPFGSPNAPMTVARDSKANNVASNPGILAQLSASTGHPPLSPTAPKTGAPAGGPGGAGGATQPDFDSLIELIKSTVKPSSWDDVGGAGSISNFENNLTLVVSQTQEVHEEIADLLDQLRRLQDLQVTIEVRFITLNDNFFERIGVSFDFNINDNIDNVNPPYSTFQLQNNNALTSTAINQGYSRNFANADTNRTVVVGMSTPTTYNTDLDIPFTQNSYALAVPQFGGFDATAGASLGFAILSDIEAYFFINAAQGDKRSNVLQAPKVTLFNGQQAMVSDTSQSPFVISVIPVVGDFAAAQQPVIVVLNEGTSMTVQAVVSRDRRFVRLTVVPFFSKITAVNTFTFTGSSTSTTEATRSGLFPNATDPSKLWNNKNDNKTTTNTGTTVQLPTFSYVTVTTTVSVPDGGTVLLGGIKRLSEGRNEFGVPLLNKLPYINRLFQNTAIGRETQSLMMMVTPRIIIQEEEEEKLGMQAASP